MQQSHDRIKLDLRRRILLHVSDEDMMLYEGKLADEFGVSRTPIRQVIQSLASEQLVEVRSGIGTIAPHLLIERRMNDLKAYSAILGACASCAQPAHFGMAKVEQAALRMHLEAGSDRPPDDLFFDVATKFVTALNKLVDDSILRSTLIACFWRFVRRRIADHNSDLSGVIQELIQTIKDIEEGAETGDAEHTLRMASTNVDGILRSLSPA